MVIFHHQTQRKYGTSLARIKLMASEDTIRPTTDCPLGPGNTCISCKHEGLRDVLKLSQ